MTIPEATAHLNLNESVEQSTTSQAITSTMQTLMHCSCATAEPLVIDNFTNSTNNTNGTTEANITEPTLYYLGLGLALGNCLFVGTSYVIQKQALSQYQRRTGHTGRHAGLGYLKEWLWWVGFALMGVGELANFLAFGFAPASLVTPLEGLTVVVTVILARIFLHESLNVYGQIGIYLCLVGSLVIVLLAPEEREISTMEDFGNLFLSPQVIVPGCFIIAVMVICGAWLGPRWGHRNPFIFLAIASSAGPVTVFGCKAIGLAISDTLNGVNRFTYWLTWVMIVLTVVCILIQLYYVNRTLASFSACIVTPVYFVMFTSSVLIVSAIAFSEFSSITYERAIVMICGFLVIAAGVFLINIFKTEDCNWRKIGHLFKVSNEASEPDPTSSSVTRLSDSEQPQNRSTSSPFRKLTAAVNRLKKKRRMTELDENEAQHNNAGNLEDSGVHNDSPYHNELPFDTTAPSVPAFVRLNESSNSTELRTALTAVNTVANQRNSPVIGLKSSTKRSFSDRKRERRAKTASKEIVVVQDSEDDELGDEPGGAAEKQPSQLLSVNGAVHFKAHRKIASDFGPHLASQSGSLLTNGTSERGLASGLVSETSPITGRSSEDHLQSSNASAALVSIELDGNSARPH